ncbi:MAG: winged helix-turn-helix domain-containing protein [Rhodothermales bacterium]|nr:winged helix-turn-helix domain-containing protein [Rhodothermales bacterium]MBO6781232.1 winged helix-turn-helix domain-containing protein [Rhodothermales bacterium]
MSTDEQTVSADEVRYRFGPFVLDVADRQLWRGNDRIELNARYLDALTLLVREADQLVEKDRFFDEVWHDVVVSDSALAQAIKEIRKELDDDASNPTWIQTVPRHGYRFVGQVTSDVVVPAPTAPPAQASTTLPWKPAVTELWSGTLGGGFAGVLGGILYGFGLASPEGGVGTISTLLVLVSLSGLIGLTGGFGVSAGLASGGILAHFSPGLRTLYRIGGAAFGGLVVGALAKLLGVDAFNLLVGRAPAGITGGPEGAMLGVGIGIGALVGGLAGPYAARWRVATGAAVGGALAGAIIPLTGGALLGGSLHILAQSFVDSQLELERIGALFGELDFGPATQIALASIEGLLFGAGLVGAMSLAARMTRGADWRL